MAAVPWDVAYARAKIVLEAHWEGLKQEFSDLTGCDVGPRIIGGRNTMTPAIRLYVANKLPVDEVPEGRRLPTEIDGVPVDVLENTFELAAGDEVVDAGDSIAPDKFSDRYGSMGLVVADLSTGDPFFLTCAHVVAPECDIDKLHPQSMLDVDSDLVADSLKNEAGIYRNWEKGRYVDAALLAPKVGVSYNAGIAPPGGYPTPTKFGRLTELDLMPPAPVWKVGRHGISHGTVQSIFSPEMKLADGTIVSRHVLVVGDFDQPFAKKGDSGAVIVRNREIVAMIRAVDNTGKTLACHMMDVAATLGIDFKR